MSAIVLLLAAVSLSGTTTRPSDGCYALGEQAEAVLTAAGLAPNASATLNLHVDDAFGKVLETRTEPISADAQGRWTATLPLPSARYGAYRVYAELDGAKLPRCGTRGEGYFTYAILPDPAKRPALAPEDSFVGLHGSAGNAQTRWLGAHWRLGKWPTGTDEEFRQMMAERNASSWTNHFLITASRIFQRPGCFSEAGRAWIKANCRQPAAYSCFWDLVSSEEGCKYLAEAFRNLAHRACHEEDFGQKLHVYEVFWEPELHYPNQALMLKAAKIAWENITSVDTNAVVAAPTMHSMGFLDQHRDLLEKGLGEYMNAFSVHPYGMPDEATKLQTIRTLRRMMRDYTGRDLPRFGTEANVGAMTDVASERRQLDLLVRTMIVLLGEGFRFHLVFYGYDYGGDRADTPNGGCGLTYNIEYPKNRWDAKLLSPKPSFAGISAFSWLLDGSRPVIALDRFKDSRLGYVFADKAGKCTIALWDWGGKTPEMTVTTGRERTRVADIFGNESEVDSPGGKLKVALSSSPVYLVDVDPALWGPDGRETRRIRAMPVEMTDPVKIVKTSPVVTSAGPGVEIELENEGDRPLEGEVRTRIRGIPEARVEQPVKLSARARAKVRVGFGDWAPQPLERFPLEVSFVSAAAKAFRQTDVGFFAAPHGQPGEPVEWAGGKLAAMWNAQGVFLDFTAPADTARLGFARMLVEKRTDNGFADLVNQSAAEFAFALGADGPTARRTATALPNRLPKGPVPARLKIDRLATGFRYRVFLDWKTLGEPDPQSRTSVRLALASGEAKLFELDAGVRRYGELLLVR